MIIRAHRDSAIYSVQINEVFFYCTMENSQIDGRRFTQSRQRQQKRRQGRLSDV